jgi:hypothetical protein
VKRPLQHLSSPARAVLVTALCAALGLALLAVIATAASGGRGPSEAAATSSPSPSPSVSGTLTTTVAGAVTVHNGSIARVRYRVDDSAGGEVTVDLLVTTRSGKLRCRLATGRTTTAGTELVWRGRLRLRRGRYLLVAHAVDASGRSEVSATTAELRVLAPLPPLVPTARARRAAFAWAAARAGSVAVAVVDSRGQMYGYHAKRPFITASVVKAMLLVAYLRQHRSVDAGMRGTLTRMITVSDNDAADAVYSSVGRQSLTRLARLAHMSTFRSSSDWIVCRVGAADMARFFRDMERYIPRRHRRLANALLARITSYQRWGIPAAAEPLGYRVYFKPGWLGAWTLANEASRLERRSVCIGLAVFTDDNPTSSYGKETIAGVTERLLRR